MAPELLDWKALVVIDEDLESHNRTPDVHGPPVFSSLLGYDLLSFA